MAKAIVTVDFGSVQTDRGDFTITDATFAGLTYVEAFFMSSDSTVDNDSIAHEMVADLIRLSCDAPVGNDVVIHARATAWTIAKTMKVRLVGN